LTVLTGRLAVVTGASRGIGLAAARALAGAGATVVRLARSFPDGGGAGLLDLPCDLTDAAQVLRASTRILEDWGPPAVVVQNAGVFLLRPFEETGPEELDRQLALNLRAPFLLARGLVPGMRARGDGLFITIGSTCDHVGYPDNSAYTASKFGLRGLHEALAAEYRGTGVRFTLVSPGSVDTEIWDPFDPDARPGFLRRALMLRPEDVADAVLFAATRPARMTIEWLQLSPSPVEGAEG
jgi:NAD(P)-dependent dehydrogenase (short-subunit alcohol dehydrogenase family)